MSIIDWVLGHEPALRLCAFLGVFVLMAVWESVAARRERVLTRRLRWPHNLGLVALDALVVRLTFPLAAVAFASLAATRGWGLFNNVDLGAWGSAILSIMILDLAIYLQHVMFHAIPALWRVHRVHHADLDFDVTTGLRFHPIEILLSMGIKLAVIAAIGAPPVAVLLFEILLNATAMFNHANLRLPPRMDALLRWVLVTPEMHRIHHSAAPSEANRNFGFNLPWWDRLLGTYRAHAALPQERMPIGVHGIGADQAVKLSALLLLPFHGEAGDYPIGHRMETRDAPH